MNRRDALKGITTAAIGTAGSVAAGVAVSADAIKHPPNRFGWPDRVEASDANAKNLRPYLDGKRVYGGVEACESEGWIRCLKLDPDNHGPNEPRRPRQYVLLKGRVEFRTVRDDGSWPD